jgi:aminopeptidase YwaD
MSFEGVSGFAQGMYLKDNLLQSVTPLNSDTTFSIFVPNISVELNRYSLVFNNVVTTVSSFPLSKSLNVYPNPAKDILNVDLGLKFNDLKVLIVDMLGNEIINEQLRNQHTSFNIQNLSSGVYFVKLINGNECLGLRKWIKE